MINYLALINQNQTSALRAFCGREWSCDYHGNSSAPRRQLPIVLRRGGLKMQPVGIARQQSKTGLSRNAADTYTVEIRG